MCTPGHKCKSKFVSEYVCILYICSFAHLCIDLNNLNPLLFGLIARKRYTCHSDDTDENSDQEESDDGDGEKDHQFCT